MTLTKLGIAAAVNTTLLAIASREFRRHGITPSPFSAYPVIALFAWTLVEVSVGDRDVYAPLAYAVLMGSIGVSAVTDHAAGYILDVVTLPSCAFGIVVATSSATGLYPLCGTLAVSGAMLFLHMITRGQGLGLGDVKLAAVTGALLGAQAGMISLGVSFVLGGCMAALLILSGRASRKMAVPFAPYMAAGTLTVLALARA